MLEPETSNGIDKLWESEKAKGKHWTRGCSIHISDQFPCLSLKSPVVSRSYATFRHLLTIEVEVVLLLESVPDDVRYEGLPERHPSDNVKTAFCCWYGVICAGFEVDSIMLVKSFHLCALLDSLLFFFVSKLGSLQKLLNLVIRQEHINHGDVGSELVDHGWVDWLTIQKASGQTSGNVKHLYWTRIYIKIIY